MGNTYNTDTDTEDCVSDLALVMDNVVVDCELAVVHSMPIAKEFDTSLPATANREQINHAAQMIQEGRETNSVTAGLLSVDRTTLYRALHRKVQ